MAFYNGADEEEDPNNPQAPQGGGVITGGAPGAGATAQKPGDNSGGGFVGIKQYLDANKAQAGKLGDQTAGVINNSANAAREGVNALNQEATNTIKGVNNLDQGTSQKLLNTAETLSGDEKNTIKNTAAASYKGPENEMGLSGYQKAADASNKANQNIANSATEQGRMNLITQVNNKPRTAGMNTFDNILLQTGGGREKLAQAATANQDVKGALDTSAQNIRGQIGRADDPTTPDVDESTGAIGQTNKSQADAYKKIQDAMGNWNTGIQGKAKTANDQRVALNNELSARKDDPTTPQDESLQFSQGLLDQMGLKAGDNIYNTDLGAYLNPNQVEAQGKDFIDQTDLARYQALQDLSGGGQDQQLGAGYNPYANVDKAGLTGAVADKKKKFEDTKTLVTNSAKDAAEQATALRNSGHFNFWSDQMPSLGTFAKDPSDANFKKMLTELKPTYDFYLQNPTHPAFTGANVQPLLDIFKTAKPVYDSLATGKQVSVKG